MSIKPTALGLLFDAGACTQRVSRIVASRDTLSREITGLDLPVHPSAANFLLVHTGDGAASWLLRRGLVVRTFPKGSPLAGFIRITVRAAQENARLVEGLSEWRAHAG